MFEQEAGNMKAGFLKFCDYLGKQPTESEIESFIEKTFWVKVVRESDAYTSLRMSKRKSSRYFSVEGIDNLASAAGTGRPVVILTGHFGSFFIPAIAFSHHGFSVYPVARSVDESPETPPPTRCYLKLNYRFSEMRFDSRYIYTDFSGKIGREVVNLARKCGIFWVAIDLPKRLFPSRRYPVNFFGRRASFPSGIIPWALKKKAIFLTAWNGVEGIADHSFYRHLEVEKPFPEDLDAGGIIQIYADRLAAQVARQPWQWLAIQVIHQFNEEGGDG